MSNSDLFPLSCHCFIENQWIKAVITDSDSAIKIGTDDELCDLQIVGDKVDPVHVRGQLVPSIQWFLIESSKRHITKFNGFKKKQGNLFPNSLLYMTLNNMPLIFTAGDEAIIEPDEVYTPSGVNDDVIGFVTRDQMTRCQAYKTLLIGGYDLCALKIPDTNEVLAVISYEKENYYIAPAKYGIPISIDGDPIRKPTRLFNGTEIRINDFQTVFRSTTAEKIKTKIIREPDLSFSNLGFLEILDDETPGEILLLPDESDDPIVIGRAPGVYMVINSKKMSRKHAKILVKKSSIIVVDNNSGNGTFVDDEKIERVELFPGEVIRFADKKFLLCYVE